MNFSAQTSTALRPFAPGRVGFYYGWIIFVVSIIGVLASLPGQTAGFSVFTDHLIESTGLTRLELAIAYMCGTGLSALWLPRAGIWLDRKGPRVIATGASCTLAATLTALSFSRPMSAPVGMVVMSVGFGFARFSGQGLLTMTSRTMLAQWFERRRGLITSLSNAIGGSLFAITPTLMFGLIERSDFRTAWRQLAIFLVVVIGTIILVFFRTSPEACGLIIDGRKSSDSVTTTNTQANPNTDYSRNQAIKDPRFWSITLPVVAMAMVSTALTFHIVDFGNQLGIPKPEIVQIFIPIAAISIPVSILGGWLTDHLAPVVIATTMATAQIVMFLSVSYIDQPAFGTLAIICWGIAAGCYGPLTSAALPKLFGRTHLGAINGFQMAAMVIGSAVGPAIFALSKGLTGSYQPALLASLTIPIAALITAGIEHHRQKIGLT